MAKEPIYKELQKLNRQQTEKARASIQVGKLISLLQNFAEGKIELSPAQVKAIQVMLGKVMPDLTSGELHATVENSVTATDATVQKVAAIANRENPVVLKAV
jgi:hypothetical protein